VSRLTYWACGGDVVATHGRVLSPSEARRLHGFYSDQAGDPNALRLATELDVALTANARWRRAAHPTRAIPA
jgi:hypothetical protein